MDSELLRKLLETLVLEREVAVNGILEGKSVADLVDGVGLVVRGEQLALFRQTRIGKQGSREEHGEKKGELELNDGLTRTTAERPVGLGLKPN